MVGRGWRRVRLKGAVCALGILTSVPAQATLIWQTNLGTALDKNAFLDSNTLQPNADDGIQTINASQLGFLFPFEGTSYNSLVVTTNGFIWLGASNGTQCCVLSNEQTAVNYFQQGGARIAPAWYDLDPAAGGSVYFNSITNPDGHQDAVLTFVQIPPDATDLAAQFQATFQVQLLDTGMVIFSYDQLNFTTLGASPAAMVGLTPASGAPVAIDFLNLQSGSPVFSATSSVYDYLPGTSNFNLSGQSIVFNPQANGTWQIGPDVLTSEVPEPATAGPVLALLLTLFALRHRRTPDSIKL